MPKLQVIDDSNRSAHWYLTPEDRCYFLHEFTAHKGATHSPENQLIFNFKKSVSRKTLGDYQYKTRAISSVIRSLREALAGSSEFQKATFAPIPPSKPPGHELHDDRMWQVVTGLCDKQANADPRELIFQLSAYEASHSQMGGSRIKPSELQGLYQLSGAPRSRVLLFDDVLTTGCHFRAAKAAIQHFYPDTKVFGIFVARRVLAEPVEGFDEL